MSVTRGAIVGTSMCGDSFADISGATGNLVLPLSINDWICSGVWDSRIGDAVACLSSITFVFSAIDSERSALSAMLAKNKIKMPIKYLAVKYLAVKDFKVTPILRR